MAMTKESMATKVAAHIQARNGNLDAANLAILMPYLQDICAGIIEEIKANMVVNVQVSNVQAGGATANGQQTSIL